MVYLARMNGVDELSIKVESRTAVRNTRILRLNETVLVGIIIALLVILLVIYNRNSNMANFLCTSSLQRKDKKIGKNKEEISPPYNKKFERDLLILQSPTEQQDEERVTLAEEHIPSSKGSFP